MVPLIGGKVEERRQRPPISNPIESVFATVRHRTVRMKGALSQDTARLMVFKLYVRSPLQNAKLVMAASRTWRRLKGQNQLPKVVNGIKFKDGIEAVAEIKSAANILPILPDDNRITTTETGGERIGDETTANPGVDPLALVTDGGGLRFRRNRQSF